MTPTPPVAKSCTAASVGHAAQESSAVPTSYRAKAVSTASRSADREIADQTGLVVKMGLFARPFPKADTELFVSRNNAWEPQVRGATQLEGGA